MALPIQTYFLRLARRASCLLLAFGLVLMAPT
jgi:hypothetical protein